MCIRDSLLPPYLSAAGLYPEPRRVPAASLFSDVSPHLVQCGDEVERKVKESGGRSKAPKYTTKFAQSGHSHVNSKVNDADMRAVKMTPKLPEPALTATLAIEFYKHKDNVVPLLRGWRKIMNSRVNDAGGDRLVFLDDGGHDGTFEILLDTLEGPRESVYAMNNLAEIRAYTRSIHSARTDLWLMLQDDDLPDMEGGNWRAAHPPTHLPVGRRARQPTTARAGVSTWIRASDSPLNPPLFSPAALMNLPTSGTWMR